MEYGVTCVRADVNNSGVYFVEMGYIYPFDLVLEIRRQWHSLNTEQFYAYQRETSGSSSDSLQSCHLSKWELLLKERIYSQREQFFP